MDFAINNLSFWILYFGVIIISTFFVIKSRVELNKFSIGSVVFYSLFLFSFLGYPVIYYKLHPYYINIGLVNDKIITKMYIISSLTIVQFFLGYYICFLYLDKLKKKRNKFNHKRGLLNRKGEISLRVWFVCFTICIILLFIYLSKVSSIALFEAFKGKPGLQIAKSRSDMTSGFPKYHWYRIIFKAVLPFLSMISLLELIKTKQRSWGMAFFISLFFLSFIMLMDSQKAPIIWYLMSLVAVILVYYNKKINLKIGLALSSISLTLLFSMYIIFMGSQIRAETLLNPLIRGITGQIAPFYQYIKLFPQTIPFQLGKTFPNPRGIFPFNHFNYSIEIAKITFGQEKGIISSVPTAFWGELWINFGWCGVIFFPIIFGIVTYYLHDYFSSRELSTIGITLMVWLAFDLKNLAFTGFGRYLLPIDIVIILFFCGVFINYNNKMNRFPTERGVE